MPDIMTNFGTAQFAGIGCGLLLIIALRARRYGANLLTSYLPLWAAVTVGLIVYATVEQGQAVGPVLPRALATFAVPSLLCLLIHRWMRRAT